MTDQARQIDHLQHVIRHLERRNAGLSRALATIGELVGANDDQVDAIVRKARAYIEALEASRENADLRAENARLRDDLVTQQARYDRLLERGAQQIGNLREERDALRGAVNRLGAEVNRLSAKQREVDLREGEVNGLKALLAKSRDAEDQAKREATAASERAYGLECALDVEKAESKALGAQVAQIERDLEAARNAQADAEQAFGETAWQRDQAAVQARELSERVTDLERDLAAMDRVVMRASKRVARAEALARNPCREDPSAPLVDSESCYPGM